MDVSVQYWEKAEFPFHAIPKLSSLGVAGGTIKVQLFHVPPWLNMKIYDESFPNLWGTGLWVSRAFLSWRRHCHIGSGQSGCKLFYLHFGPLFIGNANHWYGLVAVSSLAFAMS